MDMSTEQSPEMNGMDINQRVDFLEKTLDRIHVMISATDLKLPYIVAIDTAMIAVIVTCAAEVSGVSTMELLGVLLGTAPPLLSLVFVSMVAIPRLKGSGRGASLLYFNAICGMSDSQYTDAVKRVTAEGYIEDLAAQCHINARIASVKYHYLRWSMIVLFFSIPFWAVSLFMVSSLDDRPADSTPTPAPTASAAK
jgi:hypothetical protein